MSNDNRSLLKPNPNPERMLSIPAKKSDAVELYRPLRKLVMRRYSESDAVKVESVLESMSKCRMDMVERGDLSLPRQRDCLVHYLRCLCMVEQLFSSDSDYDSEPIMFVWYDAFCEHQVSSQRNSIQLEKAAVLFNLGAVSSQIGASCDLTTALGRHLAMAAFNAAANCFSKLWKVFAKQVSATLDLTVLFAEILHCIFFAQASELNLQQQLSDNSTNSAISFKTVSEFYRRAYDLILRDSAATERVSSFDGTWITHLYQKMKFFQAEARHQRQSSIQHKSEQSKAFTSVHDAESVTENLFRGICWGVDKWIPKQQPIYLDLVLSDYNPIKIIDGKLIANAWDKPPPYPTNLSILSSSSSSLLAIPLKKSKPLDLYKPLHNYVAIKYSESEAKRVEGFFEMLDKLRSEMQRDDLSLPIRRDCHIRYFRCLCMIEFFFPITTSSDPPIFVWQNAFNPQQGSSQHNIHLEKASVIFNLGALCTHIAASCDLTTIQGYRVAIDALNDASHWFLILPLVAEKASATIDLSADCTQMLREIVSAQIADLKRNFSHSGSDRSSLPVYPVSMLYRKAYDLLTFGPLAGNLAQSWMPQYIESKMETCLVKTGPIDVVTEQFLSGYCKAQSLLPKQCLPPCLDFLSEVDGNLVVNFSRNSIGIAALEETTIAISNINIGKN
ncbi:hypothetical protein PIB30_022223 [Stylosanthes scabra]|uniref:BRO1 domain-containing protein n=1 Tax=Stylosanthes scabra TaxID=79078 RepID=A0ABU6Z5P5_9FABA|nr:hypothetical protein [Stylosanthes scabra]